MIDKKYTETRKSYFHPKTNENWITEQSVENRIRVLGITIYHTKAGFKNDIDLKTKKIGFE